MKRWVSMLAFAYCFSAHGQTFTLTDPGTGNTVFHGSIDAGEITLTDPGTGNTVAHGNVSTVTQGNPWDHDATVTNPQAPMNRWVTKCP